QHDADAGFAADFLDVLQRLAPILQAQPALKLITNAGGMNPAGCARKADALLKQADLPHKVAWVEGDDLLPRLDGLLRQGNPFTNLDTGEPLSQVRGHVVSVNAYLGAAPIVDALRQDADVVVTGRVADASLTVAPAVHALGWAWNDWDRLAAGTVAGHLIECGAQATGGLWCNWHEAADLANVGYPIADIAADGTFTITKPSGSGGAVNVETVSEQLLYEVGDPAAYLTPDVVADFTSIALTETGRDCIRVSAARGKPATPTYKVSIAYRNGFSASGTLTIFGPDAPAKARRCGEMLLARLDRIGMKPTRSHIECLGTGECAGGIVSAAANPPEVVLRVTVHDPQRALVERFTKEFAPLVTSGPPGVTGYTTGRPPVREVFAYWPALVDKSIVAPNVRFV